MHSFADSELLLLGFPVGRISGIALEGLADPRQTEFDSTTSALPSALQRVSPH